MVCIHLIHYLTKVQGVLNNIWPKLTNIFQVFHHYLLGCLADIQLILTSSNQDIMLLIVFATLFGWVNVKTRMIIWKLEWLKVLFKITTKREVDTALLDYNFFDYFFQVLFVNVTVSILLSILLLTLFSAF